MPMRADHMLQRSGARTSALLWDTGVQCLLAGTRGGTAERDDHDDARGSATVDRRLPGRTVRSSLAIIGMIDGPPLPPADAASSLQRDVILDYIDKVNASFASNRTYANRVLVIQTVAALLVIGIVIGAAAGKKFAIASSEFSVEVWAVLVAGAVFVGLTPGFVIGRLLYNADLALALQDWYVRLEPRIRDHMVNPGLPWEIAPLVSEAGWASARGLSIFQAWLARGKKRKPATSAERLGTAADVVAGPLTFIVLFAALPIGAQVLAAVWWVRAADSALGDWMIGAGASVLVLLTLASVLGAALRLKTRAERLGSSPFQAPPDSRGAEPTEVSAQARA
jgi:hypothetical protein